MTISPAGRPLDHRARIDERLHRDLAAEDHRAGANVCTAPDHDRHDLLVLRSL
jgi:hypothetical protein